MSDPYLAPDYQPNTEQAAAASGAASPTPSAPLSPADAMTKFQQDLQAYVTASLAKVEKDVQEMMAKAGLSPAQSFRPPAGSS